MKKWFFVIIAMATIALYQNCSGRLEALDAASPSNSGPSANDLLSIAAYEKTLFPLMTDDANPASCVACHGVSQQPLHSLPDATLAHGILTSFDLVNLQDPASSDIVTKIANGHQGIDRAVSDQLASAIQAWVDDLIANGGTIGSNPNVLQPTFSSIKNLILDPKCLGCHSPTGVRPQEDYTDYISTINTGGIIPFDAANSEMFKECSAGTMPQSASPLNSAELGVIADWINDGALNN